MINDMWNETEKSGKVELLVKVLTAHYESLVSAQSNAGLLREYAALLRFLKTRKGRAYDASKRKARPPRVSGPTHWPSSESVAEASLDDIERIVSDEKSSRKQLEQIAIYRFSVPSGSMRSFSSKAMLVEKIQTLIRNERTHDTIGEVARGEREN